MRLHNLVLLFAVISASPAATLSVTMVDPAGKPVPARVYLTGTDGKAWFPSSSVIYERKSAYCSERHFVPPSGAFEIVLPFGRYRLEVERGKEYLPAVEEIDVPAEGVLRRTVRLARWIDMSRAGWYSADMHLHRRLRDVGVLMDSEDLNVAFPITRWRGGNRAVSEDPDLPAFLRKGAVAPAPHRAFTVLNEELEPSASALLVSGLGGREGTALAYPLAAYGRAARDRGALVDSEKATSLELPVIAALGGCEFIGLANNHFWRSCCYGGAWGAWPKKMLRQYPETCAGFAQAGFEMYYALLNMGFPLKLSAGSANGVHPVPPGWSRVYARVDGAFTLENWVRSLRAGRSFVTTGPMLLMRVNGREPGEEIRFEKAPSVAVDIEILSPQKAREAEVVVNGKPHPVRLTGAGAHRYQGKLHLQLDTSAWIAARWMEETGQRCDVAHTSPVYVSVSGRPILAPRSQVEFFVRRVEELIAQVKNGESPRAIEVPGETVKAETLRLFRQALDVYRAKLR